jgi:hypothetical protein
MEESRSPLKNLTGKLAGKRLLGRSNRRLENDIRMDVYMVVNVPIRKIRLIRLRFEIIGELLCLRH